MKRRKLKQASLALLLVNAASAVAAQENSLFILQDSTATGAPNAIFVDQSRARLSQVGSADDPVEQIGGGNEAQIMISGLGSQVALSQEAIAPFTQGNSVSLTVMGSANVSEISQLGAGNRGSLLVDGTEAEASLLQTGNFNDGNVAVLGENASGNLRQVGDGNETDLRVEGPGTDVTYSVIGNNLAGLVPPSVISNGATVTITQTAPGGLR